MKSFFFELLLVSFVSWGIRGEGKGMVKYAYWKFLGVESFCSMMSLRHNQFQGIQVITQVLEQPYMQPLRTFSGVLSLDFDTTCHIWWTDTDPKILSIFFPEIPFSLIRDITSHNSSCLQQNKNTHCALRSCMACQGKNYSFTCMGHSHLFFCGPSCDGLWLASDMSILMSTPQIPEAQASSVAYPLSVARLLCMEGRTPQIPYR